MMKLLSEIAESVEYGVTASASNEPVGPKFLRITDIQDGHVDWNTVPWCEGDMGKLNSAKLKPGDIVFARTGATTGKSFLIQDCPSEAVFASYLIRVRLGTTAEPAYVSHFFQSEDYWAQIRKGARGVAQPGVNATTLKSLEIPLPPLPEQKRIARILDAADALRARRRTALAELDALLQSTFLDMFGDPEGQEWVIATVEEAAQQEKGSIRTGPFGSQLLHSEFVDEGIRVLGIDNVVGNEFRKGEDRFITPGKYKQLKRYTVQPGDVLITIMGTCGRCAIVPDEFETAINTKHLCCITLDHQKCLPIYLHAYFLLHPMAQRYLERSAKGAIMSGLNMGIIKALPLPLPPLDLQRSFAAIVESVKRQKDRMNAHLTELDSLFASLQSRAFNGEL